MKTYLQVLLSVVAIIVLLAAVVFVSQIEVAEPQGVVVESTLSQQQAESALRNLFEQYQSQNAELEALVVEFSDFGCPFCAQVAPEVKLLYQNYANRIQVEYQHFPLTQLHPQAFNAAVASECAADQQKFWEYHDILFANQRAQDIDALLRYASVVGLDVDVFSSCLSSNEAQQRVRDEMSLAQSLGVQGTPTFFIITQDSVTMIEGAIRASQILVQIDQQT